MRLALRVDVDTLRGTREGVPRLLRLFGREGIRAAFFFSVGPDNMGRHLWRLMKPVFLWKMLRTHAARLYGPEILLRGTFWPGPNILKTEAATLRAAERAGHEIGVHAWDHQAWQARADRMTEDEASAHLARATGALADCIGRSPDCSAAPGWKCTENCLKAKERFGFRYNSDCRGTGIFLPRLADGTVLATPQIALGLPTYDELMGRDGVTSSNYNARLLERIGDADAQLLTIHAESEGGVAYGLFEDFIARAKAKGITFVPPGDLLPANRQALPKYPVVQGRSAGREGNLAVVCAGAGVSHLKSKNTPFAPN